MSQGIFITGTDTDVGKTTIALGLIEALQEKGLKVAVMKPVSAGCKQTPDGLRNEDAVLLMNKSSVDMPYEIVNPYAFEPAIAPHIAAADMGVKIDINIIRENYNQIAENADVVIVEGAGGWLVPANEKETMADVAKLLDLRALLVVGMRLGCLNHSLLTQSLIQRMGIIFAGWIANYLIPDFPCADANQRTLENWLNAPLLGVVPYREQPNQTSISEYLDVTKLL